MNCTHWIVGTLAAAALAAAPLVAQQEKDKAPALPGPSAEHKLLEKWAGTWDCTVEVTTPDGKTDKSPAKSVSRVACGGMWLVTDFDGTMGGMPFNGHEVAGYDSVAKKYVLTWVDGWSSSASTGDGAFDAKTNTMTYKVNGRDDSSGKQMTWRDVDVWKDADNHEWAMYQPGADGKEHVFMKISYHRHK
jgi:hypothetical protein